MTGFLASGVVRTTSVRTRTPVFLAISVWLARQSNPPETLVQFTIQVGCGGAVSPGAGCVGAVGAAAGAGCGCFGWRVWVTAAVLKVKRPNTTNLAIVNFRALNFVRHTNYIPSEF